MVTSGELASPTRRRGMCCQLQVPDQAWAERRAELLRALADPTRLSMLAALTRAEAPICICDFTAVYGLSQPTISHHMARLRETGLVDATRSGIWTYYRLRQDLPAQVRALLEAALAGA
jgi:ArsR family transcriptional regulator